MTRERKDTGDAGERFAAEHLISAGYRILARNYRCPVGELDLVAESSDTVVFVEVKTRRIPFRARPEENVNRTKLSRLMRAAEHFLVATGRDDSAWRIDVVAVEMNWDGSRRKVSHFENAAADLMRGSWA